MVARSQRSEEAHGGGRFPPRQVLISAPLQMELCAQGIIQSFRVEQPPICCGLVEGLT